MRQSIATIDSPEFINLQPLDLNPLMSSCEIKVLYLGENRNRSYITKDVASEMAKTLRGAPIVGYYREDKQDFVDHGERITFDEDGIHFECMTKPYGFVSPDAKVWFQKFEDTDDFGNTVEREYLMTTGYLWTEQFKECKGALDGKPQSMELDEDTLKGSWALDNNSQIEFFIINDAIFSKLCILGDDVEPCFEGANVSSPNVSRTFSMDDTFKNTLFNMMQDLKNFALKGGQQMENLETSVVQPEVEEVEEVVESVEPVEAAETDFKATESIKEETIENEEPEAASDCKENFINKDDEEKIRKCSLLESEYNELQAKYADLEERYNELVKFKNKIEDAKKDELINSFYMLSDEDKRDVIENKANYSYDDIESKLSVICVRKKVNFNLEDSSDNKNTVDDNPIVTFNLEGTEESVPAWISALKNTRNKNN